MTRTRTNRSSAVRARAGGKHGWVLLLAGALPALALAVPVPAYIGARSARAAHGRDAHRVDRREALRRELSAYRDEGVLTRLEALGSTVEALIPSSGGALQEFGSIRRRSLARGLRLGSIQNVATHETGIGGGRRGSVVVDEVLVQLAGTPEDAFGLVSDLRGEGQPLLVLGFGLDRASPTSPVFDQELRLGFLRRIPGATPEARPTHR